VKRIEYKGSVRRLILILVVGLAPLMTGASGGCDAFRDSLVTSLEAATGAALNAVLSDFFDGLQSNSP